LAGAAGLSALSGSNDGVYECTNRNSNNGVLTLKDSNKVSLDSFTSTQTKVVFNQDGTAFSGSEVLEPLCICLGIDGDKFTTPPGAQLNSVQDGSDYAALICT
jgi:hypothetical protein